MSIRICINCNEKYTKGVSGFDIVFSRDEYHWCSRHCMWLWLADHDVRHNGEAITNIVFGRLRKEMNFKDCLKPNEIIKYTSYFLTP